MHQYEAILGLPQKLIQSSLSLLLRVESIRVKENEWSSCIVRFANASQQHVK